VQQLSDILNRYEHVRSGALQEAAFYRAKLAAYESGSAVDIGRLDGDRAAQLESKLAALSADYSAQEARLEESRRDGFVQIRLREQAEIRALEACQRLEELEESNRHIANEYVDLQANYEASQSTVRNQAQRLFSQNSILEQKEADFLYAKTRLEALDAIQQQHSQFVEQTQTTLDVSSTRLSDITAQWEIATQKIGELEADLAEAKAELDARTAETSAATSRLAEVENAWAQSREEADALRSLTTQRLGELLDSHRDLKIDEDHLIDSHNEKVRALEVELSSLRNLQAEISEHSGQLQSALSHSRRQNQDTDAERSQLKKQILGLRAQLSDVLSESGKLHKELSDTKGIINQHSTTVSKIESKYAMLRRYVEDNGVSLDGFTSEDNSSAPRELQAPSSQTTSPQQDFEALRRQYQDALRQISALNSEVDRIRSNHESDSPRQQGQVDELRRALAESESVHQDRMRQLENDYQTAVHYVK
jgi:chromosome segregation ATPase